MNINTDCHLLPMEGAYNIRDLGGYPAENGAQRPFFPGG